MYKLTTRLRSGVKPARLENPCLPISWYSADIFNFQTFGGIGIINTEGIGHADGQTL